MYNSYSISVDEPNTLGAPTHWSPEYHFQDVSAEKAESVSGDFQVLLDSPALKYLKEEQYLKEERSIISVAPTEHILDMLERATSELNDNDFDGVPSDLSETSS